jgi:single-stranded-DNA-specific exonuclease
MSIESFILDLKSAGARCAADSKSILLLHHNDADGLSSAAILEAAFERKAIPVRRYCLEKPYPKSLELILGNETEAPIDTVIVTDFGSGILNTWAEYKKRYRNFYLLDHHQLVGQIPPSLNICNPLQVGISGLPDCTSSSICFFFALGIAADNVDLAPLALVGAVGDRAFNEQGELTGVNKKITQFIADAEVLPSKGQMYWQGNNYFEVAQAVDALGSYGYFSGGPDIAIKGLREQFGPACLHFSDKFSKRFAEECRAPVKLTTKGSLVFFELGSEFDTFGVKTVGLICAELARERAELHNSYIAGLQTVPNQIPGLGTVALDQIKVSMRVGPTLAQKIKTGSSRPLTDVLPAATRAVGGFVDACHPLAAATTFPLNKRLEFLSALAAIIE